MSKYYSVYMSEFLIITSEAQDTKIISKTIKKALKFCNGFN